MYENGVWNRSDGLYADCNIENEKAIIRVEKNERLAAGSPMANSG